jgi:hypothetical protein
MPYEYDVFLSYSHDYPFGEWVRDPFLPLFKGYLTAALGREPKLFVDLEGILTGNAVRETLKNALASSRCLVGIWSPNYFLSEWCRFECTTMLYRERKLGYRTISKPNGLVIPVSVHDGNKFPSYARSVQFDNWVQFAKVGEGFKRTERYVEFQDQVSCFADDVATAIEDAPTWDDAWLSEAWFQDVGSDVGGNDPARGFDPPVLA